MWETYDKANYITSIGQANGVTTEYTYDKRYRIKKIEHLNPQALPIEAYEYRYSPKGLCVEIKELNGRVVNYTYDELSRLIGEIITTRNQDQEQVMLSTSYTYDKVGNRITQVKNGITTQWQYDDNHRLLTDGTYTYSYDKNGNLLEKRQGDEVYTFIYDYEDRQVKSITPSEAGMTTTVYTYDASGIRVGKVVNDRDVSRYIVDSNTLYPRVIDEVAGDDTLLVRYTYGNRLLSQIRGEQTRYYHGDHIGSIRLLTDENGNVTDSYSYDAFGNTLTKEGTTINNFLYAGEQFDQETALYYLRARYMDPATGRFTSMDKYSGSMQSPISQHKYLYASANPVTYTDPTGYFSLAEMNAATAIRGIVSKMPCLVMTSAKSAWVGMKVGYITGYITEMASILDDIMVGKDPGNIAMRLQLTAITTALMSGMMGFVGGIGFGALSMIPYIGPFASIAVGFVMGGVGVVTGAEEIQQLWQEGKYLTAAVKTVGIVMDVVSIASSLKNYCFVEGTLVDTTEGKKAIETIEVGDYVAAKNLETGEVEYREVIDTSVNESQLLLTLTVAGEVIEATPNHAFYIHEKGWIEVGDVAVGDYVTLQNGDVVQVEKVAYTVLETPIKVYNFTVEGLQNYYIGELEVLVHNTCGSTLDSLNQGDANTSVYLAVKDGEIVYVGIAKDVEIRQKQHGDRFDYLQEVTTDKLTRRQARAIEQVMIEKNPGYKNKINSISDKRDWYQEAIEWAKKWITQNYQ